MKAVSTRSLRAKALTQSGGLKPPTLLDHSPLGAEAQALRANAQDPGPLALDTGPSSLGAKAPGPWTLNYSVPRS